MPSGCPICGGSITWDLSQVEELLGFEVMEDPEAPGEADHHYLCERCGRVFDAYGGTCVYWPEAEA